MKINNGTYYLVDGERPDGCEFGAYDPWTRKLVSGGTALLSAGLAFGEEDFVGNWSCSCCDNQFMSFTLGYHTNIEVDGLRDKRVELVIEIPPEHIKSFSLAPGLTLETSSFSRGYRPDFITLVPSKQFLPVSA